MSENKQFFIRVDGQPVSVTEAVYLAYYRSRRHEEYLIEKDTRHGLVHYAALDTAQSTGEEELPDWDAESVEDVAIRRVMSETLHDGLALLPDDERTLIMALFFSNNGRGMTVREYSTRSGVPFTTIQSRKAKILARLKKYLEKR